MANTVIVNWNDFPQIRTFESMDWDENELIFYEPNGDVYEIETSDFGKIKSMRIIIDGCNYIVDLKNKKLLWDNV